MKYNFVVQPMNRFDATEFVQRYHYSKVMPKLTKYFLGIYNENNLVGVLTLGWGTQPLQTIKKMFPMCVTKDYYEIGKMCMHPDMPRNSESQMLSVIIKWIKDNCPEIKYLYTWADGIVGKPGYVYQAANFYYGGFIWTDIYLSAEGEKIHPRTTRKLCEENAKLLNVEKIYWLTFDFMKLKGLKKIKGKQFRYIMPLTKKLTKKLNENSTINWTRNYPKHGDLVWKEMIGEKKYKIMDEIPKFNTNVTQYNEKNINAHKKANQSSLKNFFE